MHSRRSPWVLPVLSSRVPESATHRRHRPHVTHRIFTYYGTSRPCGCTVATRLHVRDTFLSNTRHARARYRPLSLLPATVVEQGVDVGDPSCVSATYNRHATGLATRRARA